MNPLQIVLITSMQVLASIRWVDEADDSGPIDMDIFFDRAVIICGNIKSLNSSMPQNLIKKGILKKENIAPGVFISKNYILTSYNPFRHILHNYKNLKHLFVKVLLQRTKETEELHNYETENVDLKCARQIMPNSEKKLTKEQWHGFEKMYSPVHDLMIIELNKDMEFIEQKWKSFDGYPKKKLTPAGPLLTKYATKGDRLDNIVKFASLGFRSKRHIKESNKLASRSYKEEEFVLDDCEKWMPRYWGHFICIRDVDDYKAVGSGALLIHNDTLYGVGSFSVHKGNETLLVFTDVRPYAHLFFSVCP